MDQIVERFHIYKKAIDSAKQDEEILNNNNDQELKEMASLDLAEQKQQIISLEYELKVMLLPKNPNDDKNIIIEMRPAAGGDEAAIFVSDLFQAYKAYAESKG
jgi:peptide chain release factor 1